MIIYLFGLLTFPILLLILIWTEPSIFSSYHKSRYGFKEGDSFKFPNDKSFKLEKNKEAIIQSMGDDTFVCKFKKPVKNLYNKGEYSDLGIYYMEILEHAEKI